MEIYRQVTKSKGYCGRAMVYIRRGKQVTAQDTGVRREHLRTIRPQTKPARHTATSTRMWRLLGARQQHSMPFIMLVK